MHGGVIPELTIRSYKCSCRRESAWDNLLLVPNASTYIIGQGMIFLAVDPTPEVGGARLELS